MKGPLFVVGNSRSGTTMFARMLGRHPSVHTVSELHFYEELWLPEKGGSMVGIFRLFVEDKLTSISALNLVQDGKKVKMILRPVGS